MIKVRESLCRAQLVSEISDVAVIGLEENQYICRGGWGGGGELDASVETLGRRGGNADISPVTELDIYVEWD